MNYTHEFDETSGICTIQVTGVFRRPEDSDELKRFAADFFTSNGCRLFLVDVSQTELIAGTMPTFYAGTPQGELARVLRQVKTAFVRRSLTEDDHFLETVAVNRGFKLRAFDSIDKAVAWLARGT
ncbi:hypothetical protein [Geobacter sulfurreducens]|uniref:hypothetical protein n=1 Tax=Geobacter sulfurreducens TaxID=35554 RepID=UPI0001D8F4EA|nr:hypothetical protein [Geobacter sulfurreducens]ADI85516.1 hypothetical protein KN400_2704 [Geobacter sulfurreducens KN400]